MRTQTVSAADGHTFALRICEADDPVGAVAFYPAMGVRAGYYDRFAEQLAALGWTTVVSELRGHGSSNLRASRTVNWGYRDMIEKDWLPGVQAARELAGSLPVALGGHSLGGQLSCLFAAENPATVQALILVASCTVYWKMWQGRQRKGMRFVPYIAPILAGITGYFPGERVHFAGREARQQMYDWSYNGRHGAYKLKGDRSPRETQLAAIGLPVLSVSFEGDSYAPPAACSHLTDKLQSCAVQRLHLDEEKVPADILHHFQWAREAETVAKKVADYLRTHVK